MTTRITESELVLPSLFLMNSSEDGVIETATLIEKLRELMRPQGEDLKILAGRRDDKFSQKVRNLKSHNTFERDDLARYIDDHFEITENGRVYLNRNVEILKYLLGNNFEYSDVIDSLHGIEENRNREKEIFEEDIVIREGRKKLVENATYERSSRLRDYAIEHFSRNGKIYCSCCNFNFQDFYGDAIGRGYIEIHHAKPIFKYEDEDLAQTIQHAMSSLRPVCSNCHRMIHRNWSIPLEIRQLIDGINANGVFHRFGDGGEDRRRNKLSDERDG